MRTKLLLLALVAIAGCKSAAAERGPDVERYRVPLPARTARGPADAKVTIVQFVDYQCPFCARGDQTLAELRAAYPGQVRLQLVHFPLPGHPDADLAARAQLAAEAQGVGWEMHDRLFAAAGKISRDEIFDVAADLGMDLGRLEKDLDAASAGNAVAADLALGERLGVVGTPTYFINGRPVVGAQPAAALRAIIDEELARNATYEELTRNAPTVRQAPVAAKPEPSGECPAPGEGECDCDCAGSP